MTRRLGDGLSRWAANPSQSDQSPSSQSWQNQAQKYRRQELKQFAAQKIEDGKKGYEICHNLQLFHALVWNLAGWMGGFLFRSRSHDSLSCRQLDTFAKKTTKAREKILLRSSWRDAQKTGALELYETLDLFDPFWSLCAFLILYSLSMVLTISIPSSEANLHLRNIQVP